MNGKSFQNDPKMGPGGAQGGKNESQNMKIAEKCPPQICFKGLSFEINFGSQKKNQKIEKKGSDALQASRNAAARGHGEG